jgi:hypothetical protein
VLFGGGCRGGLYGRGFLYCHFLSSCHWFYFLLNLVRLEAPLVK